MDKNLANWNKKRKVMRNYDSSAAAYDRQYTEEQTAKIRLMLQNLGQGKVSLVLDDGCGTGLLFVQIQGFAEYVVGIDFSRKLLKRAKKRAKRLSNVAVVCADADHLPFLEQIFDAAFAMTLLQNMPKPIDTFREMERVCKRGSTLAVTGLKKQFSLEEFESLINKTPLRISRIVTNDGLKDYVAVCRRL